MNKPFHVLLELTFEDGTKSQTIVEIVAAIELDRFKKENSIKELVYYAPPKT